MLGSQAQGTGGSVVLAMTDSPPSMVTILSAPVTLTGATLMPGNVPLFSGTATVDLARLQTDVAYLATATKVPAGNYTGVTLAFANLTLTIENDTPSAIGGCAVGSICTIAPTVSNMSTTVPLSSFAVATNSAAGLLIDVNLENLLSATLGADFSAGTTVTPFIPAGTGAPPVGAEDVVGQVGTTTPSSNTFTLTNAKASYTLSVDSASTFFQFPTSACATPGFSCLHTGQILSVDIGIESDGSVHARNLVFEDSDSSDAEVEGMITSTNAGSQQFSLVIQSISASVAGLNLGQAITVQYSVSPQTPFDVDLVHADSTQLSTSGFLFGGPADLTVGQQVSIRRNSSSTASLLIADRVRLRSTRLTATPSTNASSLMDLSSLPSIFSGHGVNVILANTPQGTICSDNNVVRICSTLPLNVPVSARGPLFNASGTRTMIATRVVEK